MKLRIEKAVYGGNALARIPAEATPVLAGKAVFVAGALPGELVEASMTAERRGYLTATLNAVIEPSPARWRPACEYYGRCGGCQYQHADYKAQLAMKRDILAETLERAHVSALPEIRTLSAAPWGYRNRIRLHVVPGPRPMLGFREAMSHRNLAVTHCPVAAPVLQDCIVRLEHLFAGRPALVRHFTEVEFFCSVDESALLVTLFTPQHRVPEDLPHSIAEALLSYVPQLRGLSIVSMDMKTRRIAPTGAWGETALSYEVGGLRYRVSAGAFFQVNRFLLPQLVDKVVAGQAGDIAWDLYAGVGLFACALRGFQQVIAVESSPLSAADLAHNLHGMGSAARSVAVDMLRFLETSPPERPDLVIVDPPRAGLDAKVCEKLAAIQPRRIIYVSCDPSTLARDLRALQPSGYRPTALTLIDLFPQTFHMETVATLERA